MVVRKRKKATREAPRREPSDHEVDLEKHRAATEAHMRPLDPKFEAEARLFAALSEPPSDDAPLDVQLERAIALFSDALVLLRPPFVLPTQRAQRVDAIAKQAVAAAREKRAVAVVEWEAIESWIADARDAPESVEDRVLWVLQHLSRRYPAAARELATLSALLRSAIEAPSRGRRLALTHLRAAFHCEPLPKGDALRRRLNAEKQAEKRAKRRLRM